MKKFKLRPCPVIISLSRSLSSYSLAISSLIISTVTVLGLVLLHPSVTLAAFDEQSLIGRPLAARSLLERPLLESSSGASSTGASSLVVRRSLAVERPFLNENVLLEVKTYGGFVLMEYAGHEEGVRILINGEVVGFRKKNTFDHEKNEKLATLSPAVVEKIKHSIEQVKEGELIDENPSGIMVADMPYTDYALRKKNGESLIFSATRDGRNYYIQDYRSRMLKTILSGFLFLRNLP